MDLPGYGFAKVPQPMRGHWESLVGAYLGAGRPLAGVVLIMDARHPLTPLDRQLLAWLGEARVLLLLTKADKLSRAEQAAALKTVTALGGRETRLFSSLSRLGVEDCRRLLEQWLAAAGRIKNPR